ncbi:MAG: hypothetical protein F6J87_24370 [Spirulina sp. SIO3F2]|nr:hypothetical protein [Spirulina sp. SIO3F2]
MSPLRWLLFGLFFPACLILLGQVIWSPAIGDRLLALALLLLCIDQSRAGVLDLEQTLLAQTQTPDPRLDRFYRVTICTIAVALVGFYGAWISLGFGAVIIFCSQLGFHCTAGIRLETAEGLTILPWGVKQRWLTLVANVIGVVLLGFWMQAIAPLWMASLILSMVLAYGVIKYVVPKQVG